nr:histidinol-phosphate transaminase [Methanocella sp. CWC-04]
MIKVKQSIMEMKEYVAGKSIEEAARSYGLDPNSIIKLASNENCMGPSPKAVDAIKEAAANVHIYPSVDGVELREEISRRYNMPIKNVVVGAGMDGVIETLLRTFLDKDDESVIPLPTFSYYENVTRFCSAVPVYSKRKHDYSIDTDDIIAKAGERTRFIFITSPNNPTGNITPIEDIKKIAESVDSLVFVDEAYIDFAGSSAIDLVRKYDNVIVGHTMSKAWGLAGLRIGYAFIPEWIFSQYMKVATPFNLSNISISAAIAALNDGEHYRKSVETIIRGREQLMKDLPFKALPSEANFILIDTSPLKSGYVVDECMKRGIILRDCASFRGLGDTFVRITVGTKEENERVIAALREIRDKA